METSPMASKATPSCPVNPRTLEYAFWVGPAPRCSCMKGEGCSKTFLASWAGIPPERLPWAARQAAVVGRALRLGPNKLWGAHLDNQFWVISPAAGQPARPPR
eukprot:7018206-Pyramimonas_sp.AAC.1